MVSDNEIPVRAGNTETGAQRRSRFCVLFKTDSRADFTNNPPCQHAVVYWDERFMKNRRTKYPPTRISAAGPRYSVTPTNGVPMSAPKRSRIAPGINAQERPPPPGRMATSTKVMPSPMKKSPPPAFPSRLSSAETAPSVSKTPAGMIAYQRWVLVK